MMINSEQKWQELLRRLTKMELEINMLLQNQSIGDWIPKKMAMKFFDYGDGSIVKLEEIIDTSKIGRRTFYSKSSLLDLLEQNKQKKKS